MCLAGSGPQLLDFYLETSHYLFVPGLHTDPNSFCLTTYGASVVKVMSNHQLAEIGQKIRQLREQGSMHVSVVLV